MPLRIPIGIDDFRKLYTAGIRVVGALLLPVSMGADRTAAVVSAAVITLLIACTSPQPAASSAASSASVPAPTLLATSAPVPSSQVEVAVTVDDLPTHGPSFAGIDRGAITERFIAAFRAHGLPPVHGFVNGKKVDDDPASEAILRRWIESGNVLGNHSWSHPSLNNTDLAHYIADIDKGEAILQKVAPAAAFKVFRYPFLYEGDTIEKREGVRRHLADKGYAIAEVTIDADDWAYNPPFGRCTERGDTASLAELRRSFVEGHVEELRRMRELTRSLVQREVRHVLLLHIGAADADAIEALLTAYEREGVRWIDLRTALADPFYSIDPGRPYRYGAALPYLIAKAREVKAPPPVFARDLEERLDRTCR
jgi:peptidoglycan-N-acetylglucosamine deacetylase